MGNSKLTGSKILLLAIIVIVAFLTVRGVLRYGFTGLDTFCQIESSIIKSPSDVVKIFTSRYMEGTKDVRSVYRPIPSLSYALDYSIWNLNPLGYHITDIILYIITSILLFFLVYVLTEDVFYALVSALIYAIHPVVYEVVPCIERRDAVMGQLFAVLSLLFFVRSYYRERQSPKTVFFSTVSIIAFLLALCSKEVNIFLLPLVYIYIWSQSGEVKVFSKIFSSIKKAMPYLLVTVLYLTVWSLIMKHTGSSGVVRWYSIGWIKVILFIYTTCYRYVFILFNPMMREVPLIVQYIVVVLVLGYVIRSQYKTKGVVSNKLSKYCRWILMVALVFLGLLVIFQSYILNIGYRILETTYQTGEPQFVAQFMQGKEFTALENYVQELKDFYNMTAFPLFVVSFLLYLGMSWHKQLREQIRIIYPKMKLSFLVAWYFLPLAVYIFCQSFNYRYLYEALIPFSIIIGVVFMVSLRSIIKTINIHKGEQNWWKPIAKKASEASLAFILALGLIISLLVDSPLFRDYSYWRDIDRISTIYILRLEEEVFKDSEGTTLHIYNSLPAWPLYNCYGERENKIPNVVTACAPAECSFQSYFDMKYPEKEIEIKVESYGDPHNIPKDLILNRKVLGDKDVEVEVVPIY